MRAVFARGEDGGAAESVDMEAGGEMEEETVCVED